MPSAPRPPGGDAGEFARLWSPISSCHLLRSHAVVWGVQFARGCRAPAVFSACAVMQHSGAVMQHSGA
eukprot:8602363-Pyramimonas_sp.AAC.1